MLAAGWLGEVPPHLLQGSTPGAKAYRQILGLAAPGGPAAAAGGDGAEATGGSEGGGGEEGDGDGGDGGGGAEGGVLVKAEAA